MDKRDKNCIIYRTRREGGDSQESGCTWVVRSTGTGDVVVGLELLWGEVEDRRRIGVGGGNTLVILVIARTLTEVTMIHPYKPLLNKGTIIDPHLKF